MIRQTIRCTVSTDLTPSLINNTDDDRVAEYKADMVRLFGPGQWSVPYVDATGESNGPEFVECEATGSRAMCVEVHYTPD